MHVQDWTKLHVAVGVRSHVITAAIVTDGKANGSPYFIPLVEQTKAHGFTIDDVAADKAPLARELRGRRTARRESVHPVQVEQQGHRVGCAITCSR